MAAKSRNKKSKKRSRQIKTLFFTGLILLGAALVYSLYLPNTGAFHNGDYLYIHTGASYTEVLNELKQQGFVRDAKTFDLLAKQVAYTEKVKAGRFKIKKGMNNYQLLKLLGSGQQEPIKLVVRKTRTKKDFIRFVSSKLEADSNELMHILGDRDFLAQYGLDTNTAMCAIMPNTYYFFWNTSAEKVFQKIAKTYVAFWTKERKAKAQALGLSPQEVIILASIVEEESNKNDEKPTIASVYINRIRKGMKLQADPTARFAYGDFMVKRITGVHIKTESPYNTYKVLGLPPGPICTPGEASIQAVLNAPETSYLYFCAKEDFSGYHNFASNLQEHVLNAQNYHRSLTNRGIQ